MINLEVIKKLKPCNDRLENYIKFYGSKEFSKRQFMGLKNITHEDKLWVALRLMEKEDWKQAIVDIAESVLHIFEAKFPEDKRPRKAIEAIRKGVPEKELIDAAYAAAYDASYAAHAATNAAAYDASYAANAANAAAYAANAAAYAAAYYAANAADADAKLRKQKEIRTLILKRWL